MFRHLRARFTLIAKRRIQSADAEDIAHEACLTVLNKYRALAPDTEFEAWAYQVLRNKIGNYFRRNEVRQRLHSNRAVSEAVTDETPTDSHVMMTLVRCLRKLIEVNPRYARVLNLIQLGYSSEEICDRLGVTRSNLYSIVSRARTVLSNCVFGEERSE